MKVRLNRQNANASTLLVTLAICCILAFSILGYLSLIEQQGRLGSRSQTWNIAMAVVEAGLEDALQQLNNNSANLTADGWTASGNFYWKSNGLSSGTGYYARIWVTNVYNPVVICQAYVAPIGVVQATYPVVFASTATPATTPVINRAVRVYCWRGGLFIKALAAKKLIDMNGNNIMTDSFDSTDPAYCGLGGLYDPNKVKEKGDVASNGNLINVGNANIYGHVATGPGGTINVGANGGIGTHAWVAANPGGIMPGWATDDSNFTFPDTTIPYTSGLNPTGGNVVEQIAVYTTNSMTSPTVPNPLPWGGVKSNVISTATYASIPNPVPPGMTTNTTYITVNAPPGSTTSASVQTNITGSITVNTDPGSGVGPVVINIASWVTVTSYPSPAPPGIVATTTPVKDKTAPASGTYAGTVVFNHPWYEYDLITGYKYPIYTYTYYTYSYTYPVYSFVVPTFNYTYNLYNTNSMTVTNYYDHILNTGKYYVDTLSGSTIVLGQAELVAANGISMKGNDVLKVAKGASLTNWVGGTSAAIGGNGVVNETGLAKNFVCLCSPSVKSVTLGGNGEFTGVLIAPNGDLALNGGGTSDFDLIGCAMVNSAKLNGHYKFHYDESLGKLDGNGRYLITAWDEIPPPF